MMYANLLGSDWFIMGIIAWGLGGIIGIGM